TWQDKFGSDFEQRWRQALHDGFVADTASVPISVTARAVALTEVLTRSGNEVDVIFRPDPSIWGGRFSNVAWLQELPKPLSNITWDNVICISPARAEQFGVANGHGVEVGVGERKVIGPAGIMPGKA